jgi:hypothetical protein
MIDRVLIAFPVLSACAAFAAAQPLVSTYDSSREGWTVETRTNPGGAFNLVAVYQPDYIDSGGDTGGYISELDPDNNWSFFRAPAVWHGDRSAYSGRWLRYSTRTDTANYPDGRLVILFGNGQRISHDAGIPPINAWTRRHVPLSQGAWFVGTTGAGSLATQAQIDAVLGGLEAFFIGLEFGGDLLEERVDLDRVAFGVCAADLAEPFGTLDLSDINAFATAFTANDPAADLIRDGIYDLADITQFITAFTDCD